MLSQSHSKHAVTIEDGRKCCGDSLLMHVVFVPSHILVSGLRPARLNEDGSGGPGGPVTLEPSLRTLLSQRHSLCPNVTFMNLKLSMG